MLREDSPLALAPDPQAERLGQRVRTVTLKLAKDAPLFPFEEARSHAGDQYRILKAKIALTRGDPRFFVVTSPESADGKSVTSINFAGAMALKGDAQVILVDADFRWPSVAPQLGIDNGPGLAEVLNGSCPLLEAVVRFAQIPNLYVLPAGHAVANPTEIIDSQAWRDLCGKLRATFTHVVVDTPPAGLVAEYDLLQAQADKVVLVARPDHTKRHAMNQALIQIPKEKLLGVVLNYVPEWPLAKGAGYGYYHYQKYEAVKRPAAARRK